MVGFNPLNCKLFSGRDNKMITNKHDRKEGRSANIGGRCTTFRNMPSIVF